MRRTTALFAVFSLVAVPASAQVAGLPVFNSGVSSGISLNADFGFPNEAAGKGKAWGITGGAALGPIGVTATFAQNKPEGASDASTWLGATANLKLFGGPLVPITVNGQVGLGYNSEDVGLPEDLKTIEVPVGIGIALNVPTPGLSIKPWIAPRMQYHRTSGALDDSETNFGISAGVNLGLVGGINARLAYDYLNVDTASGDKPATFSIGVGYNFNIPVVPGM